MLSISPFFHNTKIEIQRHHSSMPCSLIVKVRLFLNDAPDPIASLTISVNGNFSWGGNWEWSRLQLADQVS